MGHTSFRDAHPTGQQGSVHLWHTAVLAKAPATNQGNHLQAEFPVRQRPAPLFFGTVGHMITRALGLDTATDDQRQLPETIQPGHRAVTVVAHPEGLTTLLAR